MFLLSTNGIANLKVCEEAGEEPKKQSSPVVVDKFAYIQSGGDLLHGVSAIPVISMSSPLLFSSPLLSFQIGKNIVKKFRLSRITEQFVKGRDQPWKLYNKVDKAVEVRVLCHSHNWEVAQFLLKETRNLLAKNVGLAQEHVQKLKGLKFRRVKKSSNQRTEQLTRKMSHPGQIVTMKIEKSLLTAAHLSTR